MAKNKTIYPHAERLETYKKLVSFFPLVEVKGATMPYTSVNGNMFSFLAKDGSMGIRMPETERENFLKKYEHGLFEAHGTVLKEYVTVPETLVNDLKKLRKFFEISLNYALSLKPKQVKKKEVSKK